MTPTVVSNQSLWTLRFALPGPKAPSNLKAEAILTFHGGMLDGFELGGFSVWSNGPKPMSVSFPARSYVGGGLKKNWDLFRPRPDLVPEEAAARKASFADAILVAYHQWVMTIPPTLTPEAPTKTGTSTAFSQASLDVAKSQGAFTTPKATAEDL